MKNKGFTLLELLVVVLIIGILAGIALPQYRKSVEKAKLSEALLNFQTLKNAMDRYMLQNVCPNSFTYWPDDIQLDVELSGGEFNDYDYYVDEDTGTTIDDIPYIPSFEDMFHKGWYVYNYKKDKKYMEDDGDMVDYGGYSM